MADELGAAVVVLLPVVGAAVDVVVVELLVELALHSSDSTFHSTSSTLRRPAPSHSHAAGRSDGA